MSDPRLTIPGRWYRIRIALPRDAEDDAIGICAAFGVAGANARPAGPRRIGIEAWFEERDAAAAALAMLSGWPGAKVGTPEPEPVEDEGWLAASAAPREPLVAGRFVIIDREDLRAAVPPGSDAILLPPGRAFGTGEHATTRMCLLLLQRWLKPGERVLDLGTGSAILAIGAVLAGAGPVVAIDNDPSVIEVAEENLAFNGLAGRVALAAGSWQALAAEDRFGLVLANINRSALERCAHSVAAHSDPQGACAILSGFSVDDAGLVLEAWGRAGFVEVDRLQEREWCALALARGAR